MKEKLKIVFVQAAGSLSETGGFRIVAGYADHLQRRGHEVTLIAPEGGAPKPRTLKGKIKNLFRSKQKPKSVASPPFLENRNVEIKIINGVRELAPADLPDADVLIATWWETGEWISSATNRFKKFHLIQDHEIFPYLPIERVKAVYNLPYYKIVVSDWLREEMVNYDNIREPFFVENVIDYEKFNNSTRKKSDHPVVGFLYSVAQRKNSPLAIETCRKLKKIYPDLRVIAFGSHAPRPEHKMPNWIEFTLKPTGKDIAKIYGSCDVWLFTSDSEGYGLPILEAMASGTPVVATPAGAAPQLVSEKNGAIISHDVDSAVKATQKILELTEEDWSRLSENCVETARRRDWETATDEFEAALLSIVNGKQAEFIKN
ncbi:glycosyltransferase family 4 protein [Hyphococcus lacteus]|uniref:Glycosyltransferase family 4 protein n=1 Tax=Hyphococcus lacteus TaxID=3143536 RepID=A0ABV3Z158_9PROT